MSNLPEGVDPRELTVVARRVLLDALTALTPHLRGVTVVGAQAVYLRSDDIELPVAGSTRDADLALAPDLIDHPPEIDRIMRGIGFKVPKPQQPGTWTRPEQVGHTRVDIPVDLLVPETFAGAGSRAATIPPHDRMTARRIPGLEAVLYDHDVMSVASLAPRSDRRVIQVQVAGVPSLLIAKAHKIQDRLDDQERRPDRLTDKDAADVIRLFMAGDPDDVRARWDGLAAIAKITTVVERGRDLLISQFADSAAPGVQMAERNLQGAAESPTELAVAWISAFSMGT